LGLRIIRTQLYRFLAVLEALLILISVDAHHCKVCVCIYVSAVRVDLRGVADLQKFLLAGLLLGKRRGIDSLFVELSSFFEEALLGVKIAEIHIYVAELDVLGHELLGL